MPLILGANSVSGYTVKNSLRFNSGSTDYLNRTPASTTNRKTWTWSGWVKRGNSGVDTTILGTSDTTSALYNLFAIRFTSANEFRVTQSDNTGVITLGGSSNALYRDPSAWYHIVVAIDTTQASSSNGFKCYVNGSQITFQSVAYTQNLDTSMNSTSFANYIGRSSSISPQRYFSGYQSEVYFIDGQALTPSSFGETDTETGIWKPKAYTGTYGTNGFELEFKNSASLGTDTSGNGNNWTVNNLTSVDQSTDTPTNNFCTGNPLFKHNNTPTFSNGNLTIVTATGDSTVISTFGLTTGKWYFEAKVGSTATGALIGILGNIESIQNTGNSLGFYPENYGYYVDGRKTNNNNFTSYGNSYTTGDVIGVAFDLTNGKIWFAKNGTWQNSGDPVAGTNSAFTTLSSTVTYFPAFGDASSGSTSTFDCNFGSPPYSANSYTDGAGFGNFSYAVPSGYYSLNTKNLATFG
jgi:hypothetical protein